MIEVELLESMTSACVCVSFIAYHIWSIVLNRANLVSTFSSSIPFSFYYVDDLYCACHTQSNAIHCTIESIAFNSNSKHRLASVVTWFACNKVTININDDESFAYVFVCVCMYCLGCHHRFDIIGTIVPSAIDDVITHTYTHVASKSLVKPTETDTASCHM